MKSKNKRVKAWNRIRKRLKVEFADKGITTCEIRLPGVCAYNYNLQFAHRHKRVEYYGRPEMLGDHNQVALACSACHAEIEHDKELTKREFMRLRGPDAAQI